jgi:aryl-alcohol dehydrogenase-like predicted oxidoreductase
MQPSVSRLGLGLAALGRPGYMTLYHGRDLGGRYEPEAMEAHAHAVLDAAYAAGVRYVDVARSYGRGEAFLASWLARGGHDDVTVASKWGYTYTAGWRVNAERPEVKDLSAATLTRQLRETRAILGARLNIYQIHSVTAESTVLRDATVLDLLARLRGTGVQIGLTASGAGQADVIRRALDTRLFDSVQATWNLFERGAEAALCEAHMAGLRVVIKEALANGRLAESNPRLDGLNASPDQVALAAALARPWADIVLSGAATVAQLESNLGALAVDWSPSLDDRFASMAMPTVDYWRMRGTFAWN